MKLIKKGAKCKIIVISEEDPIGFYELNSVFEGRVVKFVDYNDYEDISRAKKEKFVQATIEILRSITHDLSDETTIMVSRRTMIPFHKIELQVIEMG